MAIFSLGGDKQKYLTWIFLILVLLLVVWFGRGFFIKPSFPPPPLPQPKTVEINFEALKNPLLKDLNPFEEIPIFEEEIGRENPFLKI